MTNFLTSIWCIHTIIFIVWCSFFFYYMPKNKETSKLAYLGLLWTAALSIGLNILTQ